MNSGTRPLKNQLSFKKKHGCLCLEKEEGQTVLSLHLIFLASDRGMARQSDTFSLNSDSRFHADVFRSEPLTAHLGCLHVLCLTVAQRFRDVSCLVLCLDTIPAQTVFALME